MSLEDMARKMDASVALMLHADERDRTEAMLVKLAHTLIVKLDERDAQIEWMRKEITALRQANGS
jgi:hypothetical protein